MLPVPDTSLPKCRGPVLIVDDHAELREAMTYALEAFGYEVMTAADGDEALAHLRRGIVPSLIVLDLDMPGKDGWTFRMEQTSDPKLAAIPTVITSGGGSLLPRAAALGIAGYFDKSTGVDALLDLVERHCLRN